MVTVSLDDPRLGEHLKELLVSGEGDFRFIEGGIVLANVSKVKSEGEDLPPLPDGKRPLGLWKDKVGPVWMAPDFSDELPDSFWLGEEQ